MRIDAMTHPDSSINTAVAGEETSALCSWCQDFTPDKLLAPHNYLERPALWHKVVARASAGARYGFLLHENAEDRREAAAAGCKLCGLVEELLDEDRVRFLLGSPDMPIPKKGQLVLVGHASRWNLTHTSACADGHTRACRVARRSVQTALNDRGFEFVLQDGLKSTLIALEEIRKFDEAEQTDSSDHEQYYDGQSYGTGIVEIFWSHDSKANFDRETQSAASRLVDQLSQDPPYPLELKAPYHILERLGCQDPLSPLNVSIRLHQISQCLVLHDCPKPVIFDSSQGGDFPLRLLDVGIADTDLCHVVYGATTQMPYAALSYCWGSALPLRSEKSNIKEHSGHGITLQNLPNTLRDAVIITRALHIRYLWIDALCIVQDDAKEWAQEAVKMGGIYTNALVTLAAVNSESCQDGIFINRPPRNVMVANSSEHGGKPVKGSKFCYMQPSYGTSDAFDQETIFSRFVTTTRWNSRGWTMQEQHLSSRTIYFTRHGTIFQCNQHEDGSKKRHIKNQSFQQDPDGDLIEGRSQTEDSERNLDKWIDTLREYTKRNLTKVSDNLVALQGLIGQFAQQSGYTALYGFWNHPWLPALLCWHVWQDNAQDARHQAPSWSWASLHRSRCNWEVRLRDLVDTCQFSLLEPAATTAEEARIIRSVARYPYADPADRVLCLTGRIMRATWDPMSKPGRHGLMKFAKVKKRKRTSAGSVENTAIALIEGSEEDMTMFYADVGYLVALTLDVHTIDTKPFWILEVCRDTGVHFIVLELLHEPRYFRRIGAGYALSQGREAFKGTDKQTVIVV